MIHVLVSLRPDISIQMHPSLRAVPRWRCWVILCRLVWFLNSQGDRESIECLHIKGSIAHQSCQFIPLN